MSKIIQELKDNPFNRVDKASLICPVCGGDTYTVDNTMMIVMDGNCVWHCENDETHKFFRHPFEPNYILHQHRHASETNFKSEQDWNLVDGVWVKC
jgi:hypothetical protein